MMHCSLLSNGGLKFEMHDFDSDREGIDGHEYATNICGRRMISPQKRIPAYDRIILLKESVNMKGNGNMSKTVGAAFMLRASEEVYNVQEVLYQVDTRDPDLLLLCFAAEAAAACGCLKIMYKVDNSPWNRKRFGVLKHAMNFFWLDNEGKPTTSLDLFPRGKQPGIMKECYKDCRPLFPHHGVYFASCLPYSALGRIIASPTAWDIYIEYGDIGRITMKKTEPGRYDVHQLQCDAVHYESGKMLAREAAMYDSGSAESLVVVFF